MMPLFIFSFIMKEYLTNFKKTLKIISFTAICCDINQLRRSFINVTRVQTYKR